MPKRGKRGGKEWVKPSEVRQGNTAGCRESATGKAQGVWTEAHRVTPFGFLMEVSTEIRGDEQALRSFTL